MTENQDLECRVEVGEIPPEIAKAMVNLVTSKEIAFGVSDYGYVITPIGANLVSQIWKNAPPERLYLLLEIIFDGKEEITDSAYFGGIIDLGRSFSRGNLNPKPSDSERQISDLIRLGVYNLERGIKAGFLKMNDHADGKCSYRLLELLEMDHFERVDRYCQELLDKALAPPAEK